MHVLTQSFWCMCVQERIILTRMYYTTSLSTSNPGWLNTANHCAWNGVTCSNNRVTGLSLESLSMTGPYPADLVNLSQISSIALSGNSLTGIIPNELCNAQIIGDEYNCPNNIDTAGCCNTVKITSPTSAYLNGIVESELGSSICGDSLVCTFMTSRDNHDVFLTYPENFPYEAWLKVSSLRVESFCNTI
jgi:hypothetical protein